MTERSDLINFIGLGGAYGWFAWDILQGGLDQSGLVGRTIGFYVFVGLSMAVVHTIVAMIPGGGETADKATEREIGHKSGRNAYIVFALVVWAIPLLLGVPQVGVNLAIMASLGAMGLAEVVRYGSRMVYRGLGATRNQRALAS